MKKLIFALVLSIFIHLLFLVTFKMEPKNLVSDEENHSKKNSSAVKFVKLSSKKSEPKKEPSIKQAPQKEPVSKPQQEANLKKAQPLKPQKPRTKVKEAKQTQPKPTTKTEAVPNFVKNPPKQPQKTDLQKEQKKQKEQTLTDFLSTPEVDREMLDDLTKSYLDLYGKEYNEFNEVQKVFLKNNLKDIGRITQRYLRYPSLAVRLQQQGTNIVEFTLYPNGDIKHLKITHSSNSTSLDDNTLETIQIAYKDYPRPKEPTKIKIYVNYFLY
jgi:protein TonB